MNHVNANALTLTACFAALACGCIDPAGRAELQVLVEAEDVIISGLQPGDGVENIQDGWALTFDSYLISIGEIELQLSSDPSVVASSDELHVLDLSGVSAGGEQLWTFDELEAGSWEFGYAILGASADAVRHETVEQADFEAMQAEGWSYLIRGGLSKADGRSCPPAALATPPMDAVAEGTNQAGDPCYPADSVSFELGARAEARFGPCEVDGIPGVSVNAGATTTVAITIHGDHLVFNGFPEGAEGGIVRLGQWLADADLNLDGVVTRAELDAISPSDLAEIDDRYQLGGSPLTPLESMWDYLVAQLMTQGHFQGEGECPVGAP